MHKFFFTLFIVLILGGSTTYGRGTKTVQDTSVIMEAPLEDTANPAFEDADEFYNKDADEGDTALYYSERFISSDSLNSLKNSKAFLYAKKLDSLLKDKQDREKKKNSGRKKGRSFLAKFFSSGIVQGIFWAVVISVVLFLLYRLFLADGIFKRNTPKSKVVAQAAAEEAITTNSDFDSLISQALGNKNYRLAVRYQYLKSLYTLAENGLVQIAPDKTNYQYVREISNYGHQAAFATLTLHYEYVWYGEFDIDEQVYKKLVADFISFNRNFK